MKYWLNPTRVRRLIHDRYVRAVVTGVTVTLILCSLGASFLELRHGVSFQAVARFFARSHLKQADLSQWVRNPDTIRQLELIFLQESGVNPGGLVYADSGALRFHPHLTERGHSTREQHRQNTEIYPRLVRHYFAADLDSLLGELNSPPVTARLARVGIDTEELLELRNRSKAAMRSTERNLLLRRAARHILQFAPFDRAPYELPLGEKLRFYEERRPEGLFVGAFEIHGFGQTGNIDHHGYAASEHNHYLAVLHLGSGRFLVKDYYRGEKREYLVESRGFVVSAALDSPIPRSPDCPSAHPGSVTG